MDSLNSSQISNIVAVNNSFSHIRNKNDEIFRGKGKRLYNHNPGLYDSVKFDYKDYYVSPNERINQILDYYSVLDKQRGRSLENKKNDSLLKFNQNKFININLRNQKRQTNLSPDNPHNKSVDNIPIYNDKYFVMKFNNGMSNIEDILKKNQKKYLINNKK